VEGGEETLLLDQPPPTYFAAWDVTANGIYFYNASTKAIEFLSLASDKITQIMKVEIGPFGRLAVSPDGRWILVARVDQKTANIMLVENFRW
jgi:CRP-like cAMP-binding protein